jgi:hypothetical protein
MKKLLLPGIVAVAMLTTSCGVSTHFTHNRNVNETVVELNQKNFEVKREVNGVAAATYVFGIGGLSRKAIQSNAHSEMMKNADLKGSEIVINPVIEVKRQFVLPFVFRVRVASYGYVIEFTK